MTSNPVRYPKAAITKGNTYPSVPASLSTYPINREVPMDINELTVVEKPITEPTAFLGNKSEATVNIFADHELCAAAASAISATLNGKEPVNGTSITGKTSKAVPSIVHLRAAFKVFPFFSRNEDTAAPGYTSQPG